VTLLGTWTVRSRRAHPFRWFVLDAALDVILTVALWWALGSTVALVFGSVLGLLLVSGLVLRLSERRLMARPRSDHPEAIEEVFAARRAGDVGRLVRLMQGEGEASDNFVRTFATRSLGSLRNPLAVDPLIAVLDDPNFDVRAAAIISLRKTADRRAAQPLATRLSEATRMQRS
jgi:HEAT repeats